MVQSWRNFAQLRKQQSSYFITTNDLDYWFEKEFLLCENRGSATYYSQFIKKILSINSSSIAK